MGRGEFYGRDDEQSNEGLPIGIVYDGLNLLKIIG
jgi:hypothetical protein